MSGQLVPRRWSSLGTGHRSLVPAVLILASGLWPLASCTSGTYAPSYVPHDRALRRPAFYFYPASDTTKPARAFILFFGNDVGFWEPHQRLATMLSHEGYDVVGLDIRALLSALPGDEPARDSAVAATIGPLIAAVRRELGAQTLPLILGGHSFGAELALWVADHQRPRGLRGVLAMSPRGRGHLTIIPADYLTNDDPSGADTFSTIDLVRETAPDVRIALVRGAQDRFRVHDSAFVAVGGERLRYFRIRFADHSLKRLILSGPAVDHALDFLLEPRDLSGPKP